VLEVDQKRTETWRPQKMDEPHCWDENYGVPPIDHRG
jgi:hypothetical protein